MSLEGRPVSLQETLRIIGLELEARRPLSAQLTVDSAGVAVESGADHAGLRYAWADLAAQVEAERGHRHKGSTGRGQPDAGDLTRWSVLLRVIGQLLDAQGVRDCHIEAAPCLPVSPDLCRVTVTVGDHVVFREAAIEEQAMLLRARRGASSSRQRGKWQFWRRG
jgi:hypothetical protein